MTQPTQAPPPGAPEPIEAWFRAEYAQLCSFVHGYVRSPEAAADVVQDLFLGLWELHEAGRLPELNRAYLFTAARNRALKWLRRNTVARRWQERVGREPIAETQGADHGIRSEEFSAVVHKAIDELPERCGEIFRLSRFHHLTYAEIAETLGISVSTVEVQMWRALKKLRERLAPYLAVVAAAGAAARFGPHFLG